ncbi:MAG: hypothetical protein LBO21_07580 [Synergistaceae bacterium]|jgi:hypothetical protein|nr:hypothetical protein [Synergistaceae bacterium]
MVNLTASLMADKYLDHKYERPKNCDFPLPDEVFTFKWVAWLEGRENDFPDDVSDLLSGERTRVWLEETPAGRIPVVYTEDRKAFEKLIAILSMEKDDQTLPPSVNAFTVPCKHPKFRGHRVIFMGRAGYSALSGESVGMGEDEWLEKSGKIRLRHECCHYFTLRVLGGMKNHALEEVVADCVGQLSALGRYDASLQRKLFGLERVDRIAPQGRLGFYVRNLPEEAVRLVCRKVNEALDALEDYLEKNSEMTFASRSPELVVKLATLGLCGIAEL